jgi:ComF family protein
MIFRAIKRLSYVLMPRRCSLCGQVVELDSDICDMCKNNKRISLPICLRCGNNVDDCRCTINDKPRYDGVIAPFYFQGGAVNSIYRFKFYGYTELVDAMTKEMADAVNIKYKDVSFDIITYVPLTKKRLKKRGYNQSQLLANSLAEKLDITCLNLLNKIKETSSQRESNAVQRRKNLKNAFEIQDNVDIKDKIILLVDDVKTTGSTINECTKVLKRKGAQEVYSCTFAITKRK